MKTVSVGAIAALLLTVANVAVAQTAPVSEARARQNALFEEMRRDPANLDLMFAYSAAALEAGDLEAAIATYERMLIFNPDLPRVQLELAVAYFRLGSYEVARFYFQRALAAEPPEEVRARVAPFLAEIDERTRTNRLSGFASVGLVYSTNATLGPSDREVRVAFFPGGFGLLDPSATSDGSFGWRLAGGVNHVADLGRPNDDVWITNAAYTGLRYFSTDSGDFDVVDIITGPRLSLDERQFGPKARPFVQGAHVRSANESLYWAGGVGVELTDTYSDRLNLFGTALAQYRDYRDADNFDGLYGALFAGFAYAADRDTVLRLGVGYETDRTDAGFQSNNELLLRGSATHQFRDTVPTLAAPLTLTAFAQGGRRWFDDPDPAVDPNQKRRDWEGRVGARLFAPIDRSYGVAVDATYFQRDSNIQNFELDSFEVGVSFVLTF